MDFLVLLLILTGIPHLKGQQRIKEFEHILLRLAFPSFYNTYNKSCCKLYPGGCYKLLDSTGYTCDFLSGRVTKTENNGWIEFKISNVRVVDGGFYRCIVLGTGNHIYRDYYIEISEVSSHHSHSHSPPTRLTTTLRASNSSTIIPESTGPALEQDRSDSPRLPWSFSLPLAVIVSITVMILITSVIGVVVCRVKSKHKQTDKYGHAQHESLKPKASETSGIVYTTVDFRAHQKPAEVYANLMTQNTQKRAPDSTLQTEHDGVVEYSMLAVHKCV